jgi:oxygen-independent coproporphyrinogen-3 oxidase
MAGLYLHIPFCSQRCVYCDFYFVTTRKSHGTFIEAMRSEIEYYASQYAEREPIETIYFGGGTPSLLEPAELGQLLQTIGSRFDLSCLQETTLEINPENADIDYLSSLRSLGVDRLSIGIQSFFPSDLEFMNRSHDADDAEACIEHARKAGFDNFSADLIFGIPDQPEEYWYANVQKLVRLGVPHISTYSLTIEDKTVLSKMVERGVVQPTGDEEIEELYRFTMNFLRDHGYEHYEISSFARPGVRSKHNQTYWDHRNYLGVGPSAHSFWWRGLPARRWFNERNLTRYETLLRQFEVPVGGTESMSIDMLADEYILLRLRTSDGIDLSRLQNHYGVDLLYEKEEEIDTFVAAGFIESSAGDRIRLTDDGKLLCDSITSKLLLENR